MRSRSSFASVLTTCLLAIAFAGIPPMADTASAGQSILKPGKRAKHYVIERKRRARGPRIRLPIGPSYIYYDYPYYYSRGYYPTHIVHYIYYPYYNHYYGHGRSHYRESGSARRRKARRK